MSNAHRDRLICPYCHKHMDNARALKAHISSRKHQADRKMARRGDKAWRQGGKSSNANIPSGADEMNKTLGGMVAASMEGANRVIWEAEKRGLCPATTEMNIAAQKGALLWLADNISDEMVNAAWRAEFSRGGFDDPVWRRSIKSALSAALRAAGDGR